MTTRVLLVEDHADFRASLAAWLRQRGFEVAEADGYAEALERAASQAFDVAVLDLMLPGASGLDVQKALLDRQPDLAVVILSGEATLETAVEALREGRAFDLLTKPLTRPERLVEAIARALGARGQEVPDATLSPREREIMGLLLAGHANARIAETLGLSERTVRNRLSMLYAKLGVETRTQAVLAYRKGR